MNYPIDTCDNGACAFAIRVGQDKNTYAKNIGKGGGTTRLQRCAWCINSTSGGAAQTLTLHYHKEGWSNFLGMGSSKMLATCVMTIWEV